MPNARNAQHVDYVSCFLNHCLTPAGLAIHGAAALTAKTVNTITYTIDGDLYTKTAVDPIDLLATSYNPGNSGLAFTAAQLTIPIGGTGYLLLCVNAAGTVKTFAGVTTNPAGVMTFSGMVPDYPIGFAPFGRIKIVAGSAQFVAGTTALDAAGLTVTYKDVSMGGMNVAP